MITSYMLYIRYRFPGAIENIRSLKGVNILRQKLRGQGKFYPLTGHEGPEGERTYSSTVLSTSALDGGGWSTPRSGRFTPRKDLVPVV